MEVRAVLVDFAMVVALGLIPMCLNGPSNVPRSILVRTIDPIVTIEGLPNEKRTIRSTDHDRGCDQARKEPSGGMK